MGLLEALPKPPEGRTGFPWTEELSPSVYDMDKEWPTMSIVTPSYNQGQYIEETIRAVLLQNYPNLEYIITDGGSTDETKAILEKYDEWIAYWVSEKDDGQTDALNKGLAKCTGDVFNWINSDDYYSIDCFKILAGHFRSPDVWAVSAYYRLFDDRGVWEEKDIGPREFSDLPEKIYQCRNHQPSTFFRLDKILALGGLDSYFNYVMDQDIWIKFLLTFGDEHIKNIDDVLAHFRVHSDSKTDQHASNLFSVELYTIFYALAMQYGLVEQAEILDTIKGGKVDKDFEFKYQFKAGDKELIAKTIHGMMCFNAKKYDSLGDRLLVKRCLDATDPKWLNEEQKAVYDKLKKKNYVYPLYSFVKNIFSKG